MAGLVSSDGRPLGKIGLFFVVTVQAPAWACPQRPWGSPGTGGLHMGYVWCALVPGVQRILTFVDILLWIFLGHVCGTPAGNVRGGKLISRLLGGTVCNAVTMGGNIELYPGKAVEYDYGLSCCCIGLCWQPCCMACLCRLGFCCLRRQYLTFGSLLLLLWVFTGATACTKT